jgi:hypothetical protein
MSGSSEKIFEIIWETKSRMQAKSFRDVRDWIPNGYSEISPGDVFWVKYGLKTKRYVAQYFDGSIRLVESHK